MKHVPRHVTMVCLRPLGIYSIYTVVKTDGGRSVGPSNTNVPLMSASSPPGYGYAGTSNGVRCNHS
jgi:hypothetical protein